MRTVGLIVEYNPLHNGHVHHFREAKRITGAEASVAVMSGCFLQRGEPAVVDKWTRAEMALRTGADLVLELPVAYAVQPAEWFAYGAVKLLDATGVVTDLCFGTEAGDLAQLLPLAELLHGESGELKSALAEELGGGASYPAAFAAAAARLAARGDGAPGQAAAREILMQPNNSLGLHYLIALRRLGSAIRPSSIPRQGAGYHDEQPGEGAVASATAVRRLLAGPGGLDAARPYIPAWTADLLAREFAAGRGPVNWEHFRAPLFRQLLLQSPQELAQYHEVTEGLEYRLQRSLQGLSAVSVDALLDALKTRRYTRTKLQRMLVHLLLGHRKEELSPARLGQGPEYLRVLGFSPTGRQLLARMKQTAALPVLTRTPAQPYPGLQLDIRAASLYESLLPATGADHWFRDYKQPPLRS
ncbi:nucleotidyltransferase [Paenibacillus yonginensis]|uniref:tRNA(Met) cytidine acetate ligase n=1 Tax=Paenibacillus yonginensis TaxID=1462996 RepID=A0A1B1MXP4_9BACL|nr:nucleotidyltransferase [Paenibacillus yonginensis]ANS73944.1 nucleotidyltransferase [Paenibacillus yonginensis]